MGFRFNRSVRLAPGLRMNVGKRGLSLSAGGRGASVTFGARGTYANVGIPGTGFSYRARIDGGPERKRLEREHLRIEKEIRRQERILRRQETLSNVKLKMDQETGSIAFEDAFGESLSRGDLKLLWEQQGKRIREFLFDNIEEINGDVSLITQIHEDTPSPDLEPEYSSVEFFKPRPKKPNPPIKPNKPTHKTLKQLNFFRKLIPGSHERHSRTQVQINNDFRKELALWESKMDQIREEEESLLKLWGIEIQIWEDQLRSHKENQENRAAEFGELIRIDEELMNELLEKSINALSWPRETLVTFELREKGKEAWLDVDLPEIEDLPQRVASLAASGRKLNIKSKAQTILRGEYATHIHGIGFRLAGTAFATLPALESITISGYSQRPDKTTGTVNDDYLYSVVIDRTSFSKINFGSLDLVDPIEALGAFNIRRKMTKTGIFSAINPFSPPSGD